jgi:hypothetical protein
VDARAADRETQIVEELYEELDAARDSGLRAHHPLNGDLVLTNHGQRVSNNDLRRKRPELGSTFQ